ncbi:serine hydrolase [Hyphomonas sp.]|uniref:serine hydrolase domain-containing protein n=1 Tax=Hyphomonas sp. TaxID=87 RepID=UPI0025C57E02|nr:serine hydrolase domain-containing protein [Hyphomonas sp.]
MKNKIIAALAALPLLATGCAAGSSPTAPVAASKESSDSGADNLTTLLDELAFSGTLLVSKGDDILLREAVNAAPTEDAADVTLDTRFPVASMTKSFTAALVLKLVDEKKLGLDQTLTELLPDFDAPYAGEVTVRHLLQNRSGIPHYIDIPGWFNNDVKRAFTNETFIEALEGLELKFTPGRDYLYSNVNYFLLALIIDRHSGMDYETRLQTQILDPLGMTETRQLYQDKGGLAVNYLKNDDGVYEIIPVVNPVLFRGTASMVSTADDLNIWGHAVMDGAIYSEAAAAEAFHTDTPMAWSVSELPVSDDRNVSVTYYNGRLIGYLSLIMLVPEEDGVIVILNNNTVGYDNMIGLAATLAADHFGGED